MIPEPKNKLAEAVRRAIGRMLRAGSSYRTIAVALRVSVATVARVKKEFGL